MRLPETLGSRKDNIMSSSVPPPVPPINQAPLPPGKKPNLLLWVLGGVAALMIAATVTCGLGGYFLMRKAKQAGFDADLIAKNPAYASAKMAVTVNPELEVVSSDDGAGTITVREKKTRKTMTMKFDADKKTMVITGEEGKEATIKITGEGDKGAIEVQSADGAMKFGGATGNQVPAWMPVYPGSSPQGSFSAQSGQDGSQGFTFKTPDPPSKVANYYQDSLKSAGFTVTMATTGNQGGVVMAEDGAKKRTILLTLSAADGGTSANVMLNEKK
jgi:hypothetical protein